MKASMLFNQLFMSSVEKLQNETKIKVIDAIKIARLVIKLAEAQRIVFDLKDNLFKEYSVIGHNTQGEVIFEEGKEISDEIKQEYINKIEELFKSEIEIPKIKLSEESLSKIEINPLTAIFLMNLIDFPEEE